MRRIIAGLFCPMQTDNEIQSEQFIRSIYYKMLRKITRNWRSSTYIFSLCDESELFFEQNFRWWLLLVISFVFIHFYLVARRQIIGTFNRTRWWRLCRLRHHRLRYVMPVAAESLWSVPPSDKCAGQRRRHHKMRMRRAAADAALVRSRMLQP